MTIIVVTHVIWLPQERADERILMEDETIIDL
jgi:hypothetical protein